MNLSAPETTFSLFSFILYEKALPSFWMALWFIAICLFPGQLLNGLGPLFFGTTWYDSLSKPSFHPLGFWFFILVFVVNYSGIGLALWQVWQHRHRVSPQLYRSAISLFTAQLLISFPWTLLVYGYPSIFLGFVLDVIDDIFYLATMIAFARISRTALLWLLPAAVWFTFTTYLKLVMWQLNG